MFWKQNPNFFWQDYTFGYFKLCFLIRSFFTKESRLKEITSRCNLTLLAFMFSKFSSRFWKCSLSFLNNTFYVPKRTKTSGTEKHWKVLPYFVSNSNCNLSVTTLIEIWSSYLEVLMLRITRLTMGTTMFSIVLSHRT